MTNLKLPNMSYENLKDMRGKVAYATTVTTTDTPGAPVMVAHHGNIIAALIAEAVFLDNCGYDTRTTAHRLNVIAADNGLPVLVAIRDGSMVYIDRSTRKVTPFTPKTFKRG